MRLNTKPYLFPEMVAKVTESTRELIERYAEDSADDDMALYAPLYAQHAIDDVAAIYGKRCADAVAATIRGLGYKVGAP